MEKGFRIGTHVFHDEPNMNYVFNRIYAINGGDLGELKKVSSAIRTLDDWKREFLGLAEKAMAEKRIMNAAAYFRGANFFISPGDPDKVRTYDTYVELIREIHRDDFDGGPIRATRVPYEGGYIPVWHGKPETKAGERNVVVLHLGYDSLKEELIPVFKYFLEAGMEIYLFEGPGQGEAIYRGNLHMTHEWEKPVKAVLDFFDLDDVTLIGLSLGGYLAPRAGVHETRISRVIAWGVMYDFFDVVISRREKALEIMLRAMVFMRASGLLNAVSRMKMKRDTYAKWGIEQGMKVFGVRTPYEYFRALKLYSMKKISHLVKQDFLLLGSTHDHFIPGEHFCAQARALVSVRSFTGRIFTKSENAENHVNFGNTPLVLRYMAGWIREHAAGM